MVLKEITTVDTLISQGNQEFPDIIKFCIDRKRKVVAIDESMHIDMEYELIDDGSSQEDIFGGDIVIKDAPNYSIKWDSHPNIEQNRLHSYGKGRLLTDEVIIDELFDILKMWVK
ncbi:MAG: DUF5674 family protein [Lachnospiraceae bacterium]